MGNKNLFRLLLIFYLSQTLVSCGSYINLDFVNRKHIRKISEIKNLCDNKYSNTAANFKEYPDTLKSENKFPEENTDDSKFSEETNNAVASITSTLRKSFYKKKFSPPAYYANSIPLKKDEVSSTQTLKPEEKESHLKSPNPSDRLLLEVILSILLPPLAVFLHQGQTITNLFWIDVILTICGWVPGMVLALVVVFDIIN